MSQLGLGLGLSNVSSLLRFSPLDLDPYLLFDTQSSMIGTLENPTLDLDPSKPDTLNVITATRAGVATYTDVNGNIATASADTVRVDYTQGAELTPTVYQRVGYTDFSSGWGNANSTFVDGSGLSGNASKILTGTSHGGAVDSAVVTEDGVTYTGSFYIRRVNGTGNLEFARYGSASSDTTPLFTESVSTDWVRVDLQFLGKSGGGNVYFGVKIQQIGDSVEIAMPQVEEGTTASSFVANTTGSPKFISSAVYSDRVAMVLIEPSATNLVTYSEDFSHSSWGKTDVTVSAAPVAAPDGTMTASHVVSTGSNAHVVRLGVPSGTHTNSIWARTASGAGTCFFKASGLGGVLTTVTDQWQRFDVPSNTHVYAVDFRGDSTLDEIYIWGAQLEAGSVATSYIPTAGSTVTRAADDLEITGSAFSSFFNNSEGTIYCEFNGAEVDYNYIYNVRQDAANEIRSQRIPSGRIRTRYTVASAHIASPSPSGASQGSLNRHAFSYKTNNFRGNSNGGSDDEQLSGNASLAPVSIQIGGRGNGIANIKFKRLIYWPYHSDSL